MVIRMTMRYCTICSDAALIALIECFSLLWCYIIIYGTHLFSQFSLPFSSFPQHKEKTKIFESERCTEGTKFLHKHGRPQVSLILLSIMSLHPSFWMLVLSFCSPGNLFVWLWISHRSIYIFYLCVTLQKKMCSFPLCEQRNVPLKSLILSVTQKYKKRHPKNELASCVLTLKHDTLCTFCRSPPLVLRNRAYLDPLVPKISSLWHSGCG